MKPVVMVVSGDDWLGVYVDGKIVDQRHSFNEYQILELVLEHCPDGFTLEYDCLEDERMERLENEGHLPDKLEDLW